MKISPLSLSRKILNVDELLHQIERWKLHSKRMVFTNGVFDILHEGHIASLCQASSYGDILIVAVNSDDSVKKLKGDGRPVNTILTRTTILSALLMVDAVIEFNEDNPLELIKKIMPDVLVKGGDYTIEQIAGAKEVIENGGKVILADMVPEISTTHIISKIKTDI